MDRARPLVLLVVFGTGVFLAGLELMITAVALPSILADLVAANGTTAWLELRKASWIVNGYLLVYILVMPLAGRLADLWGARRLFLGALAVFTVGSALAGAAQDLDQLIAARLVQAVGGGVLVPVGTAAAAHLYDGPAGPRALGVIGALTFLGMAVGPVPRRGHPVVGPSRGRAGRPAGLGGPAADLLAPAWRWIFYVNVPIGRRRAGPGLGRIGRLGDAAPARPGRRARAPRCSGSPWQPDSRPDPARRDQRRRDRARPGDGDRWRSAASPSWPRSWPSSARCASTDPFLDVRLFRDVAVQRRGARLAADRLRVRDGDHRGAVFVDRVLYGGPDEQRLALGALAGATARRGPRLGLRSSAVASYRVVTLVGLALSVGGLVLMARWTRGHRRSRRSPRPWRLFGLGFGLTVTPRSTAAVEAAGRAAFGVASSVVTVARMIGMAVGLAILTAYGSTTIDRLSAEVYATPDAYLAFIPETLRDRPLRDPLVVEALESWASREAASIMVGLFVVAALVTRRGGPAGARPGRARAAVGDRDGRRRPMRRAYAGRRWQPRARPHPLTAPTGRAGEPMTRRHAPTSAGAPGPGPGRRGRRRGRSASSRARRAIEHLPALLARAGHDGLGRPRVARHRPRSRRSATILGLHPLIVEDVLEGNQRAKIETTDGVIHIVLFALTHGRALRGHRDRHRPRPRLPADRPRRDWEPRAIASPARRRWRPILARGPDHLLWAICDDIVDGYFPFADALGRRHRRGPGRGHRARRRPTSLERLFALKRELIEVRRAAGPTREVFNQLTNRDPAHRSRRRSSTSATCTTTSSG